jgi:hypothetical protein
MKWLIAAVLALLLAIAMPFAIGAVKRSSKGHLAGVAMAIGFAFAFLLDPAQRAAIENIEKKKDLGDNEAGEGGELID